VLDPPEHDMHGSYSQVLLHPSPSTVFPSSHSLTPKFFQSPQSSSHVSLLVDVPPEHVNPLSIVHKELHPSPLIVFPSSHPDKDKRFPSPHN